MTGATLIELLVVLAILGILLGLSAASISSVATRDSTTVFDSLRTARAVAVRSGRPVVVVLDSVVIRLLPDGRVLGGALDPLTGEPPDAR